MARHTLSAVFVAALLAVPGQPAEEEDREAARGPVEKVAGDDVDLTRTAELIVGRTNAFRKDQGEEPVQPDEKLMATARYFADYMARTDEYGHTADGSRPADRAKKHGYEYCLVSENIAYAYDSRGFTAQKLADKFVTGWKESPGHRKNMLDADVTDTGVAVARSETTGYYYAVQMFGRPKSRAIEFSIDNRSGDEVTYAIGDESFTLPPRYVRTHTLCRPGRVAFHWPGEKAEPTTLTPRGGDKLVVARDGDGFRVRKE